MTTTDASGAVLPRDYDRDMAKILTVDQYLTSMSDALKPVGAELARIITDALSDAEGTIWHGHPTWLRAAQPIAAFKAHSDHVTFMIWAGQLLTDRSGRLVASGSATMATLKAASPDELDAPLFTNWLHQADKLNS